MSGEFTKTAVDEAIASERRFWRNALTTVLANPNDLDLVGAQQNEVREALRPVADLVKKMRAIELQVQEASAETADDDSKPIRRKIILE